MNSPQEQPKPGRWKQTVSDRRVFLIFVLLLWFVLFAAFLATDTSSRSNGRLALRALGVAVVGTSLAIALANAMAWVCCWKNFRKLIFALVATVTLIALFYGIENWRGRHGWEKFRRAEEAAGAKFDLVALAPPAIPDGQNLALSPLLKPVSDVVWMNGRTVWADTNGLARVQGISPVLPSRDRQVETEPGMLTVEGGAMIDLEAWRHFYSGHTNYPQPSVSGTAAADVLVALGKFDAELEELKQAAAARPRCRFPVVYDHEPAIAVLLPHLSTFKGMCTTLNLRAVARLANGQTKEAFEDLLLTLRLADSLRGEPILISQFVRSMITLYNLQTVREGLAGHAWTEEQLSQLQRALAAVDLLEGYELGMQGERALAINTVDYMRRERFKLDPNSFVIGTEESRQPISDFVVWAMPDGWFYQNELFMARLYRDYIPPIVDAKARRVFPEKTRRLSDAIDTAINRPRRPYSLFARTISPELQKIPQRCARAQAFVDAAQVACALERYRLTNGRFPDQLDALVPALLKQIPHDVIDGKPLRYRLNSPDSYVLYSIGWNESDDGGTVVRTESGNPKPMEGDWVWFSGNQRPEVGHQNCRALRSGLWLPASDFRLPTSPLFAIEPFLAFGIPLVVNAGSG